MAARCTRVERAAANAPRRRLLRAFGASRREAEELLAYTRNPFVPAMAALPRAFPLADELFVRSWERYAAEAAATGAWPCLREKCVQLRFPIEAGISRTEAYRAATLRGRPPPQGGGGDPLILARPSEMKLLIQQTPAGRIPVIVTAGRSDFITLLRAFTQRNEPAPVPESVGACIVSGYNNWERIRCLHQAWQRLTPSASARVSEFRTLLRCKELYHDRFILLSTGPYSAIPAASLDLDEQRWLDLSLTIRLEHECTHYVTQRVLGSMRNALHDELIADYVGISAALGEYRAKWFLEFIGIAEPDGCRTDGRLHRYRGEPPLSDGAFAVLCAIVVRAARNLERFDPQRALPPLSAAAKVCLIVTLAQVSLEQLASEHAEHYLHRAVRRARAALAL